MSDSVEVPRAVLEEVLVTLTHTLTITSLSPLVYLGRSIIEKLGEAQLSLDQLLTPPSPPEPVCPTCEGRGEVFRWTASPGRAFPCPTSQPTEASR